MIGQIKLCERIKSQINECTFPRFSILVGPKGSGKKLLAHNIGKWLNCNIVECGTKVDEVRTVISQSYKTSSTTLFIFPDADKMSVAAKNALLKVTEEPPNNVYFIMTLEDEYNTLNTIRSRGTVYNMRPYNYISLSDYIKQHLPDMVLDTRKICLDICSTPGEINHLMQMNPQAFNSYVILVVDNIAEVSGSNAFKIGDSIAFKEESDKYDIKLFWKAFMNECFKHFQETIDIKYITGIQITSRALRNLKITGINKQSLFDRWLLDIRQEWME